MDNYYKNRIDYIFKKFKKLYIDMLEQKDYFKEKDNYFLPLLGKKAKQCYPKVGNWIDRVNYYYYEVSDSDEKMDYLIRLYKNIKEDVYEE